MNEFIITNSDSIKALMDKKKRETFHRIKVETGTLDENKAKRFEKKLNKYFFACGCEMGAIFAFTAIIAYLIIQLLFLKKNITFTCDWQTIKWGLLVLFTAALSGKITGLVIAKFKVKTTIKKLKQELKKFPSVC